MIEVLALDAEPHVDDLAGADQLMGDVTGDVDRRGEAEPFGTDLGDGDRGRDADDRATGVDQGAA